MRGVQLAHIDKDGGYLLLPAALFPLTDFPTEPLYRRFPDRSSRNNGRRRYRHIGRSSDVCHTQNFSCPTHWGTRDPQLPRRPRLPRRLLRWEKRTLAVHVRVEKPEAAGTLSCARYN